MQDSDEGEKFLRLMFDVTTKCNLDCPVCYRTQKDEDAPLDVIKNFADKYKNKIFVLCGGEPTVRDDLDEIIKVCKKNNEVFLVTNGVKLADEDYVKKLKDAGLQYVYFSLNGLDDEIYEKLNGVKLLDTKLRALENLKKLGMKVCVSVLMVRGVNDKEEQIKKLMDYCMGNRDFIREVRFRAMVSIGRHLSQKKYSVPELLNLVCISLDMNPDDVKKEFEFRELLNDAYGLNFLLMPCSLNFYVKVNGSVQPLFKDVDIEKIKGSRMKKISIVMQGLKVYGLKTTLLGLTRIFMGKRKIPWIHNKDIITIGLRSNPEASDFDAESNKKCPTGLYMSDKGKFVSFCRANIIKEKEWKTHCEKK